MICCCTGHRPKGFPWKVTNENTYQKYITQLKHTLIDLIENYHINEFISGMALGADMDVAESVLSLKEKYKVKLLCALPCSNQCLKWKTKDIERYNKILSQADNIKVISNQYTSTCMYERNKFMVDNSDIVFAIWNGKKQGGTWQTINYAIKQHKEIKYLRLDKEDFEIKTQ